MKKISTLFLALAVLTGISSVVYADGCYICRNKDAYVKFSGEDTQDKRKQAEACGCEVGGTRSECYAANLTILCSVSLNHSDKNYEQMICMAPVQKTKVTKN